MFLSVRYNSKLSYLQKQFFPRNQSSLIALIETEDRKCSFRWTKIKINLNFNYSF